ncbi:MAG: cobalt-precorrin-5B (C(1))-methyltransferase [Methanoregula sp.]|nr:cobalt-precorrin-5B (C(1))-methyltransferase [Methanoregula sp.]
MLDPVTGFEYPPEWVERSTSPALLPLVEQGLAILTASGTVLRRGFTTGTTAASACKAAVLSLSGNTITSVSIHIPCGLIIEVTADAYAGRASCKKYAGDYPSDVTAGVIIVAEATQITDGIHLEPGEGIGRFIRDTPRYHKGEPAISLASLDCIMRSIEEGRNVTGLSGILVKLHIPKGAEVAKKTLNSRVGVEGGISILGTTGLVEPWDDHLEESVCGQVSSAKNPVITTGRIGLRYARLLYPEHEVILVGGKIGEALDAAPGAVFLCGLPALILRHINPQILDGTGYATVEEFAASSSFEPVMRDTLANFKKERPKVHVVLVDRNGAVIGESP